MAEPHRAVFHATFTEEENLNATFHEDNNLRAGFSESFVQSGDYEDLTNKPQINGVTLVGNKTTEDLGIQAGVTSWNGETGDVVYTPPVTSVNSKTGAVSLDASDVGALPDDTFIPTNTSDLNNDSGFITSADVPTKVSELQNDSGFITGIDSSDVTTALGYTPYNASNPSGYVNATQAANAAPVQSVNGQTGNVSVSVPTKVSQLQNDSGYLTTETDPTVPSWAKEANPPQYELTYDPLSSTGLAQTGDAVTNEPNYTPAGMVNATLNWEYKNNKLYIYGINTTFSGNGVRFAVEQEQE